MSYNVNEKWVDNKVEITSFRENGMRIDWKVTDAFTGEVKFYHTNQYGEGIFEGEDFTRQAMGTLDFQLKQKHRGSVLRYLKTWFY